MTSPWYEGPSVNGATLHYIDQWRNDIMSIKKLEYDITVWKFYGTYAVIDGETDKCRQTVVEMTTLFRYYQENISSEENAIFWEILDIFWRLVCKNQWSTENNISRNIVHCSVFTCNHHTGKPDNFWECFLYFFILTHTNQVLMAKETKTPFQFGYEQWCLYTNMD